MMTTLHRDGSLEPSHLNDLDRWGQRIAVAVAALVGAPVLIAALVALTVR